MIWPEFEDGDGGLFPDSVPVPMNGTARMWILVDEMRPIHRERIQIGVKGLFMEGPRQVAESVVTRIVGLGLGSQPSPGNDRADQVPGKG